MPDNIKGVVDPTILIVQICLIAQIKDFYGALHNFDGFKIIKQPFLLKKAKTQDCLLQGQAQLDQRVVFHFFTLRLRGGVSFDKKEKLGLKMHFKSF